MSHKLHLPELPQHRGLRFPAKVISYIFHPLFMPFLTALAVLFLNKFSFIGLDDPFKKQLLANIGLNTIFFPLICTLLLKALGFIESIQMHTSKDRIIPLIATMIFYFWCYQIMKNLQAPLSFRVLLLGYFWGVIVVFIANIFVKISMHTAAAGGLLGMILVVMMIGKINLIMPLLAVLLLGGIIGTARMVLKAHKPREVWLGYFAGVVVQVAAYWWLK